MAREVKLVLLIKHDSDITRARSRDLSLPPIKHHHTFVSHLIPGWVANKRQVLKLPLSLSCSRDVMTFTEVVDLGLRNVHGPGTLEHVPRVRS